MRSSLARRVITLLLVQSFLLPLVFAQQQDAAKTNSTCVACARCVDARHHDADPDAAVWSRADYSGCINNRRAFGSHLHDPDI